MVIILKLISLVKTILEKRKLPRWLIFCEFTETVKVLQKELGKEIDMREVKNKLKTHLVSLFELEII